MATYFQRGGAMSRARQRIRAREAEERRVAKAKAAKKDDGGGGFSLGDLVPDLGIGQAVKEIGAIPGGLIALATGKGGYGKVWSGFGKGLLASGLGTMRTLDPLDTVAEVGNEVLGTPQPFDWASEKVGDFLASTDEEAKAGTYMPKGLIDKYRERGLLGPLIEDIGNAALVGGAATKLARLGTVGKLAEAGRTAEAAAKAGYSASDVARAAEAAGEQGLGKFRQAGIESQVLKRAGKAAEKAKGLEGQASAEAVAKRASLLDKTEAIAHPYRSVWERAIRPVTRAAQQSDLARAAAEGANVADQVDVPEPVPAPELAPVAAEAAKAPAEDAGRYAPPLEVQEHPMSLERQAADAEALRVYDELAKGDPADPAVRSAAESAKRIRDEYHSVGRNDPLEQIAEDELIAEAKATREPEYVRAEDGGGSTLGDRRTAGERRRFEERRQQQIDAFAEERRQAERRMTPEQREAAAQSDDLARQAEADRLDLKAMEAAEAGADELADAYRIQAQSVREQRWTKDIIDEQQAADPGLAPDDVIEPRVGPTQQAVAEQAARPIPQWATKLAESMPQSVRQKLSRAEGWIEGRETRAVYREKERFQEAERRRMFHSSAVQKVVRIASEDLVGKELPDGTKITPAVANQLLGDEVMARLEGTHLLEAAVIDAGANADDVRRILVEAGARHAEQIPTDWLYDEAGNPTGLGARIDDAVEAWRGVAEERTKHLKGGRLGERGLENIDSDELTLTKKQARALRAIHKEMAAAGRLDPRIAAETARASAQLEQGEQRLGVLDALIERLREQQGDDVKAVEDLYPETRPSVSDILAGEIYREGPPQSIRQKAARLPQIPGETPAAARRRGYRAGLAVARHEAKEARIKATVARRARLAKSLDEVRTSLVESSLPSQLQKAKMEGHVQRGIDRLARQLETPGNSQVPSHWKPIWGAFKDLHKAAETNPGLADALEDLPATWETVLRVAAENGFDPTHVNSIPEEQVRQLVYGQVRLGASGRAGQQIIAGQRKVRLGNQAMTRSIEALAAGLLQATHEANSNALVDHIESVIARPVENGVIPKGWVPWDPERNFILRGKVDEATGNTHVAQAGAKPTKMIPVEVKRTIDAFSRDFDHGVFKGLTKILNPWRALVLTMSPRWYVNNFIGNVALATVEGVKIRDWIKAWQSYRQRGPEAGIKQAGERLAAPFADIPEVTHASLLSDFGGEPSVIPYPKGKEGLRMARETGGVKEAAQLVTHKMARANEVVDELARAAVYHRSLRVGKTAEEALTRSFTALVDYGDLSPFERQLVRSVVPFYAWQKGVLKLVAKFPIDHPIAAGIGIQLTELQREMNESQYGGQLPEAYAGLVDVPGIGSINTRGFNPFQDSSQLVTPQGIASSLNPLLEIGIRNAFGAPEGGFAKHYRVNEFGSLVPDTSPSEDVGELGATLPQSQLGSGLTGVGGYEGQPEGLQAAGRFVGANVYTPEQVKKMIRRVRESQRRQAASR